MAGEVETRRARLVRLCAAYARIVAAREPAAFAARPLHHGDEAGHWDSSYPPKQVYSDRSGPRTVRITERETEDVATTGGFYYSWRRVTTAPGLHIGPDGRWYHSTETGTGELGQFAAHPGDCGVECEIEYTTRHADSLTVAELTEAERVLRDLAFPLVASRQAEVRS
jgi:hypothetical protein